MNAEWLKEQFERNPDKTKAGLAKAIGLEPPAISKILANTRQIKAQEYISMRTYFDLQNGDFNHSMDYGLSDKESVQSPEWGMPSDLVQSSNDDGFSVQHTKVVKVQETTMQPDFYQDDYVAVDFSDADPSRSGVFLVSDGYGQMFRQCEVIQVDGCARIRITATAKGFLPQDLRDDEFKILGRVIGKVDLKI